MAKYFGTDGIRGVAGQFPDIDLAGRCGHALGVLLQGKGSVVVAMDTRTSGYALAHAMASGLAQAGVDVCIMGVAPTPAVAYTVKRHSFSAGVMISASHNPPEYNGIKIFGADGYKLSDEQEEKIEQLLDLRFIERGASFGKIWTDERLIEHYIQEFCRLDLHELAHLHMCIDCGHGAACMTAPQLFDFFGANVAYINSDAQGNYINVDCGALFPQTAAARASKLGKKLSFSFDGDADRVLGCYEGKILDGDALIYILALWLKEQDKLHGNLVIGTVMTNFGLEQSLKRQGIKLVRTPVGDKYVIQRMIETGAALGGETSGHIIVGEYCTTGDGVLAALLCASIIAKHGLQELLKDYQSYPQVLKNIKRTPKTDRLLQSCELKDLEEQLFADFDGQIRLLIRPSGTEPVVRLMAEGSQAQIAVQRLQEFFEK